MGITAFAGVALLCAWLCMLLRELQGNAPILRACASALLLGSAALLLAPIIEQLRELTASVQSGSLPIGDLLLRGLGVGLLAEFTAALCRDLGEPSLGSCVTFLGRLELLCLALPFIKELAALAKDVASW